MLSRSTGPTQTTSGPAFVGELESMHAAVGQNVDMYAAVAPANSHEAQNSQLVEVTLAVQPCNHGHDDIKAKVDEFRLSDRRRQ
jgi:hypothetical protein